MQTNYFRFGENKIYSKETKKIMLTEEEENEITGEGNETGKKSGAKTDDAKKQKSGKKTETSTGKKTENKSKAEDDSDDDESGESSDEKPQFTQSQLDSIVKKRLESQKKTFDKQKDMSDKEKADDENATLKAQILERDTRDNFVDGIGIAKKDDALKMFRYYREDLEVDKDGNISNLKNIRKQAKEDFPAMFKVIDGDADAGDKNPNKKSGASGGDMNSMLRQKTGR